MHSVWLFNWILYFMLCAIVQYCPIKMLMLLWSPKHVIESSGFYSTISSLPVCWKFWLFVPSYSTPHSDSNTHREARDRSFMCLS